MRRRYSSQIPIVPTLLIINCVMFLLQLSGGSMLVDTFALWPLGADAGLFGRAAPGFHLWQLVSYSFLHGGLMHLLLNMYALWLFGSRMESVWGARGFIIYYFVCVVGAGMVQLFVASQASGVGSMYPTIGASGGVFGLLLAFGMTFPNERLMLAFPPIELPAKWFVFIYGLVELYFGVSGTLAGVAHFAHLGGMLFGFLLLWYWRQHPPGYG